MAAILSIALINNRFKELNPLDFGKQECGPDYSYGPSIRKYTLIHYVFSGCGVLTNPSGTYTVSAGEAFLIRPGEITTYVADSKTPWHYTWIGFDGELSAQFASLPSVLPSLGNIFNDMQRVFQISSACEEFLTGKLFELYACLFNNKESKDSYLLRISNYIDTKYNSHCDVADIAAALNLERHYLARLYKQKTGKTLKMRITEKRMEEAKRLLAAGNSVSYSAQMSGYNDVFVFSKMFKKLYGISPREWAGNDSNDSKE